MTSVGCENILHQTSREIQLLKENETVCSVVSQECPNHLLKHIEKPLEDFPRVLIGKFHQLHIIPTEFLSYLSCKYQKTCHIWKDSPVEVRFQSVPQTEYEEEKRKLGEGVTGDAFRTDLTVKTKSGIEKLQDFVLVKVPHPSSYRQEVINNNIHECFIGIEVVNHLRKMVPNFMYTYGFGLSDERKLSRMSSELFPIYIEYIKNEGSLHKFLHKLSPVRFLSALLQILFSLQLGYTDYSFVHLDLHDTNVLMDTLDGVLTDSYIAYPIRIESTTVFVRTLGTIARIIDYGYAQACVNGKQFVGPMYQSEYKNVNWFFDFYKLISFCMEHSFGTNMKLYNFLKLLLVSITDDLWGKKQDPYGLVEISTLVDRATSKRTIPPNVRVTHEANYYSLPINETLFKTLREKLPNVLYLIDVWKNIPEISSLLTQIYIHTEDFEGSDKTESSRNAREFLESKIVISSKKLDEFIEQFSENSLQLEEFLQQLSKISKPYNFKSISQNEIISFLDLVGSNIKFMQSTKKIERLNLLSAEQFVQTYLHQNIPSTLESEAVKNDILFTTDKNVKNIELLVNWYRTQKVDSLKSLQDWFKSSLKTLYGEREQYKQQEETKPIQQKESRQYKETEQTRYTETQPRQERYQRETQRETQKRQAEQTQRESQRRETEKIQQETEKRRVEKSRRETERDNVFWSSIIQINRDSLRDSELVLERDKYDTEIQVLQQENPQIENYPKLLSKLLLTLLTKHLDFNLSTASFILYRLFRRYQVSDQSRISAGQAAQLYKTAVDTFVKYKSWYVSLTHLYDLFTTYNFEPDKETLFKGLVEQDLASKFLPSSLLESIFKSVFPKFQPHLEDITVDNYRMSELGKAFLRQYEFNDFMQRIKTKLQDVEKIDDTLSWTQVWKEYIRKFEELKTFIDEEVYKYHQLFQSFISEYFRQIVQQQAPAIFNDKIERIFPLVESINKFGTMLQKDQVEENVGESLSTFSNQIIAEMHLIRSEYENIVIPVSNEFDPTNSVFAGTLTWTQSNQLWTHIKESFKQMTLALEPYMSKAHADTLVQKVEEWYDWSHLKQLVYDYNVKLLDYLQRDNYLERFLTEQLEKQISADFLAYLSFHRNYDVGELVERWVIELNQQLDALRDSDSLYQATFGYQCLTLYQYYLDEWKILLELQNIWLQYVSQYPSMYIESIDVPESLFLSWCTKNKSAKCSDLVTELFSRIVE